MKAYLDGIQNMRPSDAVSYAQKGVETGACKEPDARAALLALYQTQLGIAREAARRPGKSPFRGFATRAAKSFRESIEALEAGAPLDSIYPKDPQPSAQ